MSDSSPSELLAMLEVLGLEHQVGLDRRWSLKEFKHMAMRECVLPADCGECNSPEKIAKYWLANAHGHYPFDPDVECLAEILLNTWMRPIGHVFLGRGVFPGEAPCFGAHA